MEINAIQRHIRGGSTEGCCLPVLEGVLETDELNSYGKIPQDEYLDEAYRFLYTTASKGFVEFCAKKEGMSLDEYCDMLGVFRENLVG